jgi:Cu2+-exporting ATPase
MSAPDHHPDKCIHCGLDLGANHRSSLGPYCCQGCRVVHELIHASDLERFYELRPSQIAPASDLKPDNMAWVDVLLEDPLVQVGENIVRLHLDLQGLHCAACVWLLEELYRRSDGGRGLTINPALGTAEVIWDQAAGPLKDYLSEAEHFGYRFGPPRKSRASVSRWVQVRMGISISAALNVMMYSLGYYFGLTSQDGTAYLLFGRLIAILATVVVIVGGWPFFSSAWQGVRRGVVHLDLPIAVGILLGYTGSVYAYLTQGPESAYFDTITIFVALMLVGRWLQEHILERNRNALLASGGISDLYARRLEDGQLRSIPASELRSGNELWTAPGDLIPVECVLLQRSGSISLDWITGESRAESRQPGDRIPAGAFNAGDEGMRLAAVENFSDSRLHDLLRTGGDKPVHADEERGWWHRLGTIYVATILSLALLGFFSWVGRDLHKAIEVTIGILVVTCPCALGLALPLGRELVHVALRRRGILLRNDAFLDRAMSIHKILFDKTGTLTHGQLVMTEAARLSLLQLSKEQLTILWNMAERSGHPVSRCIASTVSSLADSKGNHDSFTLATDLDGVREEAGLGLELQTAAGLWRLGRPGFALPPEAKDDTETGKTIFSLDGNPVCGVLFAEELRTDAIEEVRSLTREGYEVYLLSGDAPSRAQATAGLLGLKQDRIHGGLTPEGKADLVAQLDERDTLMVGDGLNDSPSFDAAWCAATPAIDRAVLPQKADFYYLGDGVSAVRRALLAARHLSKVQRGNLWFAAGYNALAVGLCLAGIVTPVIAAILMPVSSLTVVSVTTWRLSQGRAEWMSS